MNAHVTDAALAADLAEEAGKLLLAVRDRVGFGHPWLLGDEGDIQANALLLKRLRAERPADAVLSEEAYDDLTRVQADRVWIVDPLDGTREFSWQGRDDWAVHVALWQRHGGPNGAITDAAVALPAMGSCTAATPSAHPRRRTPGRSGSPPARTARPPCCTTWPGSSTSNSSKSVLPEPKPCRWSAATPTPTSTPAASGNGIRPHRPA